MTCNSCETIIQKALKKIPGVRKVQADYRRLKVDVIYDFTSVAKKNLIETIEKLGYEVIRNPQKLNSRNKKVTDDNIDFQSLLVIGTIIYIIYLVYQALRSMGIDFLPEISQNMGYGILFVVGLLTSLHCVAMCGGINLSQCVTGKIGSDSKNIAKLKPSFLYNSGRVISYTLVGGIVGGLGSVISLSGWAKGIVAIFAGIMMVIMGLNMLNVFPALKRLNPRMPKIFGRLAGEKASRGPFIVGLLNGLMPCGPLQAMQLYALGTGSIIAGATAMFFFSLGTVPLMFGLGAISSFLSGNFTRKMMKTSAVLVMVLGIIMLNRGLGLSGVSVFASSPGEIASIKGNIQVVTTSLDSGRYTQITVQKGIPVKWIIEVEEGNLNGCNNPLIIPKYNYTKELQYGKNVIEFVPDKTGKIVYTCWMGMIRSNITVVDDINNPQTSL
ncbi:MAG TPA: heavy metal transporter [Peptococcaceae bacterium]|nr:heavy metal transporter [Peptococcaceae bacterium]